MKNLEQLLQEYKKFGVTYNPDEKKVTIPESSAFKGMCGASLKERIRTEMDENEIDHSDMIWLISGDHNWKSYFASVEEEKGEDYSKADLRLFKNTNNETEEESKVWDSTPNPRVKNRNDRIYNPSMLPERAGLKVEGMLNDEAREEMHRIIKKYGAEQMFGDKHSTYQGFSSAIEPDKILDMIEEFKRIPGIKDVRFVGIDELQKMHEQGVAQDSSPNRAKFRTALQYVPDNLKKAYLNMELAINELCFYGVNLDSIETMQEKASTMGVKEFNEKVASGELPLLISVPEDSILLYEGVKACGDEFAKLVGKRLRDDIFFDISVKIKCKIRKGEKWDQMSAAYAGATLAEFYTYLDEVMSELDGDDYKSVD